MYTLECGRLRAGGKRCRITTNTRATRFHPSSSSGLWARFSKVPETFRVRNQGFRETGPWRWRSPESAQNIPLESSPLACNSDRFPLFLITPTSHQDSLSTPTGAHHWWDPDPDHWQKRTRLAGVQTKRHENFLETEKRSFRVWLADDFNSR